jgi:hypothetical protein
MRLFVYVYPPTRLDLDSELGLGVTCHGMFFLSFFSMEDPSPDADSFSHRLCQLIFSVFKTLTDQRVTVELKNDLSITGTLKSVDQ